MQSSESIFPCFTNFVATILVVRFRRGITDVFACNLSQLQESQ